MAIRRTVLNWQKGFNRFWLLMTAVVAVGGFIAATVNPHNESLPKSLQEVSVFVTALFYLAMTAFVSVLFFVLGHGVHMGRVSAICGSSVRVSTGSADLRGTTMWLWCFISGPQK